MGKHPLNLALRFLLELAALGILAVWGWNWSSGWQSWFFAIVLPLFFAALWGIFAVKNDPSRSGKTVIQTKGSIRLLIELAFFGLSSLAFFDLDMKIPGNIFLVLVVSHYVISYDRIIWLFKHKIR